MQEQGGGTGARTNANPASHLQGSRRGTDAFDAENRGALTLEEAYEGFRAQLSETTTLDGSLGPRDLRLGTGMLIANGGVSGFERGALKLGPRKAWEMAAIVEVTDGRLGATLFYVDPNELPSNDTGNRLAGGGLSYRPSPDRHLGASYLRVVESNAPHPRAGPAGVGPPVITFGPREDLNALSVYGRTRPSPSRFPGLFTALDGAFQSTTGST